VPGAYSRSAAIGGGGGSLSAGNGVIMGKSTGGKPWKLYVFSTVGEAREALVDGELLKAVSHAFSPGPGYAPQAIRAMRVNPGTQAARTMKSGANDILAVKSYDYGVHTNQLKMRLAAGTNPGTKKALFAFKEGSQTIDNIGKQSFSVQYTGTGSGALLSVSGDTLTAIARKSYGGANVWYFPVIMLASKDVVPNPDLIEIGDVLTIPDLQKNLDDPKARANIKGFLKETAGVYDRKTNPNANDIDIRDNLLKLADTL
jgi:hypothetical protein